MDAPLIPNPNATCQCPDFPDCDNPQTDVIYERNSQKLYAVCDAHYRYMADHQSFEYWEGCPNCGCGFPVN